MVVVDGEQAREQQIETQQEQSKLTGQQDRRASRSSRGQRVRQAEEQPAGGCQRQSATKAGAPSGTIKQNKTKPEFCEIFIISIKQEFE